MINKTLLLILSFCTLYCKSQTFTGKVIDKDSKEALEFVNIGIVGKNIGTVANEQGVFNIPLPSENDEDTLRFSIIGYQPVIFKVKDFKTQYPSGGNISLKRNTTQLKEVVVFPKKYKTKVIGNTTNTKRVQAGFSSNDLGSEIGTLMKVKGKNNFIEKVSFNISNNTYDSVRFRVNIYTMKNGFPDESILKEPIYVGSHTKSGTLTVDLKKYNLYVTGDFLVSLEWLKDLGKHGLYFSCGFLNSPSYARKTSQGKWVKIGVGMGFNATVTYEK